jgi:predicted chitinase
MTIQSRSSRQSQSFLLPHAGPWLGIVRNYLDPTYMGGLEVSLIKSSQGEFNLQNETFIVRYMSPFYGVTDIRNEGTNSADFNDVQKSYGMWFVPPDIGTTVMCMFVNAESNSGYWIGCIPSTFQNHMVPGIGASQTVAMTAEQQIKYGTRNVPVGEFLKKGRDLSNPTPDKYTKPIHPFADRLLAQGLLTDTVRGVTSSSARREIPSMVFGISTPGPLDPNGKKGYVGYDSVRTKPVSRLGGTQFVMDDGDKNGENELVRIRTRTGHQILLHNSHDLIYIANSKGTAWIEMTSNGKLDIYAQDSVSIHTEQDFNFRADRDINLEAGRNINLRSVNNMETNVGGFHFLTVDGESRISVSKTKNEIIGGTSKLTINEGHEVLTGSYLIMSSNGSMDLASEGNMRQSTGKDFHVGAAGNYYESATQIHMNGPAAESAATASVAEPAPDRPLYSLPNRKKTQGWENGKFYKADPISSIMQRVPTHEPWDQHENINPQQFTPASTDNEAQARPAAGIPSSPRPVEPIPAPPNTRPSPPKVTPPANPPQSVPGTCDPQYAKDLKNPASQQGIAAIKAACAKLGHNHPNQVAALLGIAGGETRWKTVEENFNYTADRLLEVFPGVFKGDRALAQQWAGNPGGKFPEFIYGYQTAKGKGLGNTEPGDGEKFIGRGYIQITGRGNYQVYKDLTGHDLINNPKLLNDPTIAAEVSVRYMQRRCKVPPTDPGYFEAAMRAVGANNVANIKAKKRGFYECFLIQLKGAPVTSSDGTVWTDSSGNPIRSSPQ